MDKGRGRVGFFFLFLDFDPFLVVFFGARLILSSLEQDYQKMVDTGNTSHTDMYSVHAVRLAHR